MQNNLRNIQTKFGSNWSSNVREEDFWKKKHRKRQKNVEKGHNSKMAQRIKMKILPLIDFVKLNAAIPRQSLANPNGFGDICEKLLSDLYVLSFFLTAVMFFDGWKVPTSVLCRIPQETFIPGLVLIGQVVSEEKSFEKLWTTTDAKWWKDAWTIHR